jgi:hypothetical protein
MNKIERLDVAMAYFNRFVRKTKAAGQSAEIQTR